MTTTPETKPATLAEAIASISEGVLGPRQPWRRFTQRRPVTTVLAAVAIVAFLVASWLPVWADISEDLDLALTGTWVLLAVLAVLANRVER